MSKDVISGLRIAQARICYVAFDGNVELISATLPAHSELLCRAGGTTYAEATLLAKTLLEAWAAQTKDVAASIDAHSKLSAYGLRGSDLAFFQVFSSFTCAVAKELWINAQISAKAELTAYTQKSTDFALFMCTSSLTCDNGSSSISASFIVTSTLQAVTSHEVLFDFYVLSPLRAKSSYTLATLSSQDTYMVRWEKFFEYVLPSVQGCPLSMVESAVRSATIEFCEKTLLWKQDSDVNDVFEDMPFYTFAPPPEAKVVMVVRLSLYSVEILQIDLASLETFSPQWRELKQPMPQHFVQLFDDTIRLVGIPTEDLEGSLVTTVALKPTRDAAQCPSFLYNDWAEAIAAGALTKLHAMRGKVWALPELVMVFDRKFREGISRARSKSDKSRLRESKDMLPVSFSNKSRRGYF